MKLRLNQVVPWGRSFSEYIQMFDIDITKMPKSIIDCGGGPSSFNSEATVRGYSITSCDPIYQFSANEIAKRIDEVYPMILEGFKANHQKYVWGKYKAPEALCLDRMEAMRLFLADFQQGSLEKRYRKESLPKLSFDSGRFDLALCSHLLFTYSEHLSLEFHLDAITEMCRVATEVRIFPLLVNMTGETSPLLVPVMRELEINGYCTNLKKVPYEFQKEGNKMLQVFTNETSESTKKRS